MLDTRSGGKTVTPLLLFTEIIGTFCLTATYFLTRDTGILGNITVAGMLAFWTCLQKDGMYNAGVTWSRLFASHADPDQDYKTYGQGLVLIFAQVIGAAGCVLLMSYFDIAGGLPAIPESGSWGSDFFSLWLLFDNYYYSRKGTRTGMKVGLGYFSVLSAFPGSSFGGNLSIRLGVIAAHKMLDAALPLQGYFFSGTLWPLLTAYLFGVDVWRVIDREVYMSSAIESTFPGSMDHNHEIWGAFYLCWMYFGISAQGGPGVPLAIGSTLYTLHTIFNATLNPAVSLARTISVTGSLKEFFSRGNIMALLSDHADGNTAVLGDKGSKVKRATNDNYVAVLSPLFNNIIGGTWGIFACSCAGANIHYPTSQLRTGLAGNALLETAFTFILATFYIKAETSGNDTNFTTCLLYLACTVCFASPFNPAFPVAFKLGWYLNNFYSMFPATHPGLFGDDTFHPMSMVSCLAGGILAGVYSGKYAHLNEAVGAFFLFLTVGIAEPGTPLNYLAIGGMLAGVMVAYKDCTFNPALTLSTGEFSKVEIETAGLQVFGATIGALVANSLHTALGAATAVGINEGRAPLAEFLITALFMRVAGGNPDSVGIAYFSLLAVFGATGGSVANPAMTIAYWFSNAVFGAAGDPLGLLGHVAAPVAGAIFSSQVFALLGEKRDLELPETEGSVSAYPSGTVGFVLDKFGLSVKEVFGSFLLVLATTGVSDSGVASPALAYGMFLTTIFGIYSPTGADATDLFPAVSASRSFGEGFGVLRFSKKLVGQILGAVLAVYTAMWLFPHLAAETTSGHPVTIDPVSMGFGVAYGMFLAWGYMYCKEPLEMALLWFTLSTIFTGAYPNSAATFASAFAKDGGIGFITNVAWLANFFAPIAGGIIAGRLARLFG